VLRVRSTGVCGTDLHLAGDPLIVPPGTILGHEFAGEVAAVGPDVDGWRVDERACALPAIGCGRCAACVAGDTMGCPAVRLLGAGDLPGAFAEFIRVGARETFPLPDAVGDDAGALVEPLAFGLHAVRAAVLQPGDGVVVLGGGPVGLAIAAWCRHVGTERIAVVERVAERRAHARALGAVPVDATDPTAVRGTADLLGGAPHVVFECVGRAGMLGRCVDLVARRGRIVVAGAAMEHDALLPAIACLKEVDIRFVVSYALDEFALALRTLAGGQLPVAPLVTSRVPLDALPETFAALRAPSPECKVMVHP
jgi:(R,R)-butanediol dehydrogenase/meso-butanediol dehydrogenase/diacetyl reductase